MRVIKMQESDTIENIRKFDEGWETIVDDELHYWDDIEEALFEAYCRGFERG
jgi:hypothetical protein